GLILHLPPGLVDPSWPMVVDADLGLYWRPRPEGIFIGWEKALPWDQLPREPPDPVPCDLAYLAQARTHARRLTRFWRDLRWGPGFQHAADRPSPGSSGGRTRLQCAIARGHRGANAQAGGTPPSVGAWPGIARAGAVEPRRGTAASSAAVYGWRGVVSTRSA